MLIRIFLNQCLVDVKWTVKIADWEYCMLYTHLNPKKSPLSRLRRDADEVGKENAAFNDFWYVKGSHDSTIS